MQNNSTADVTVTYLAYGDTFMTPYPYTRFTFGTDNGYRAAYGEPAGLPGTPWANPQAACISSTPQVLPVPVATLAWGSLVTTDGYGTYSLQPDHNRNVKFVPVAS